MRKTEGLSHDGRVAQLDRASACGAEGRRFEPCRVHQYRICKKTPSGVFFSTGVCDELDLLEFSWLELRLFVDVLGLPRMSLRRSP